MSAVKESNLETRLQWACSFIITWGHANCRLVPRGDSTAPSLQLGFATSLLQWCHSCGHSWPWTGSWFRAEWEGRDEMFPAGSLCSHITLGWQGQDEQGGQEGLEVPELGGHKFTPGDCCYTGEWIDPPAFRFFISVLPERKLLMFVCWGLFLMTPTLRSMRLCPLLPPPVNLLKWVKVETLERVLQFSLNCACPKSMGLWGRGRDNGLACSLKMLQAVAPFLQVALLGHKVH